ncbi:MAG: hypothetical protein JWP31_1822, partial [Aeromicrobium sp.]|nr:hypothetical protein [Aeromicrobium sp.]
MKSLRLLGAAVLLAALPACSDAGTPASCESIDYSEPGQGRLSFHDDFTGSSVDSSKWNVRDEESLSFDSARIRAANVTVHDGLLDIAGKRETVAGREWTTGYLDTIGTFSQEFGRWEMRAKVSTDGVRTRGVWPAFWLRGDSTPGEIDVMETYGAPATQTYDPSRSYEWTIWKDTTRESGDDKIRGWAHP